MGNNDEIIEGLSNLVNNLLDGKTTKEEGKKVFEQILNDFSKGDC